MIYCSAFVNRIQIVVLRVLQLLVELLVDWVKKRALLQEVWIFAVIIVTIVGTRRTYGFGNLQTRLKDLWYYCLVVNTNYDADLVLASPWEERTLLVFECWLSEHVKKDTLLLARHHHAHHLDVDFEGFLRFSFAHFGNNATLVGIKHINSWVLGLCAWLELNDWTHYYQTPLFILIWSFVEGIGRLSHCTTTIDFIKLFVILQRDLRLFVHVRTSVREDFVKLLVNFIRC